MKKQEILDMIAAGENSIVEFKLDDLRPADTAKYVFEATDDFVRVTVGKASVKDSKSVGKSLENGSDRLEYDKNTPSVKENGVVGKTPGKILSAIRNNAKITIPELADLVRVTERSVERNLQKLQNDGRLNRVGGRKMGYWEVVD